MESETQTQEEAPSGSDLTSSLGLSAPEMLSIFNRMYLESWTREMRRHEDLLQRMSEATAIDPRLFLEVLEVVVTAARDAAVLTMFENNEKIVEDMKAAGMALPEARLSVD